MCNAEFVNIMFKILTEVGSFFQKIPPKNMKQANRSIGSGNKLNISIFQVKYYLKTYTER